MPENTDVDDPSLGWAAGSQSNQGDHLLGDAWQAKFSIEVFAFMPSSDPSQRNGHTLLGFVLKTLRLKL